MHTRACVGTKWLQHLVVSPGLPSSHLRTTRRAEASVKSLRELKWLQLQGCLAVRSLPGRNCKRTPRVSHSWGRSPGAQSVLVTDMERQSPSLHLWKAVLTGDDDALVTEPAARVLKQLNKGWSTSSSSVSSSHGDTELGEEVGEVLGEWRPLLSDVAVEEHELSEGSSFYDVAGSWGKVLSFA